jgi:hypothetical protein
MPYLFMVCRAIVGFTFILSAFWKLRNRAVFDAVVADGARVSPREHHPSRGHILAPAVALLEFIVGAGLFFLPIPWIPALAAVLFLIIFSVFLLRAPTLVNGCGCWRPPQSGQANASPYLVRNGFLIILAGLGAASEQTVGIGARFALIATGFLPALLVMEVPAFVELMRPARRPPLGGVSGP